MLTVLAEIAICLTIALIFGLIIGWKLAKNAKDVEFEILSDKYLKAEKEIKDFKSTLLHQK